MSLSETNTDEIEVQVLPVGATNGLALVELGSDIPAAACFLQTIHVAMHTNLARCPESKKLLMSCGSVSAMVSQLDKILPSCWQCKEFL